MKTTIYMVRHAQSPYDEGTERTRGLTAKGMADVEKITEMLKGEGIDVLISSPYRRAILSIEGVAQYLGLEITVFEELREKHFSDQMIGEEKLWLAIQESFNDFSYTMLGGESNADCQSRAISIVSKVLKANAGKKIAIGTHGMIMTLMMNYFDSTYGFEFLRKLSKPDIFKLTFEDTELIEVTRLWNE